LAKLLQSFPEPRVMRSHKIRGSGDENGYECFFSDVIY